MSTTWFLLRVKFLMKGEVYEITSHLLRNESLCIEGGHPSTWKQRHLIIKNRPKVALI